MNKLIEFEKKILQFFKISNIIYYLNMQLKNNKL